jgi:hypothetical protein
MTTARTATRARQQEQTLPVIVASTPDGPVLALPLPAAASAAGYSVDVLRLAITRGDLTARYANSKPVIRVADLDQWLANLPTEAPPKH